MYQLMILDQNHNIVGVCSNDKFLPKVEEVYPNKNYIGVETEHNPDLVYNYRNYFYKDGKFTKKPTVNYEIAKTKLTPSESTIITVPKGTIAVITGAEYLIDDGTIEYQNSNIGKHIITLKLQDHIDTTIEIEVVAE